MMNCNDRDDSWIHDDYDDPLWFITIHENP